MEVQLGHASPTGIEKKRREGGEGQNVKEKKFNRVYIGPTKLGRRDIYLESSLVVKSLELRGLFPFLSQIRAIWLLI